MFFFYLTYLIICKTSDNALFAKDNHQMTVTSMFQVILTSSHSPSCSNFSFIVLWHFQLLCSSFSPLLPLLALNSIHQSTHIPLSSSPAHLPFFTRVFFNSLIVLFLLPTGTLLRGGGRPGVPVAPSGRDGETADVWWSQRARRGDCGDLLADVGQPWCRHTRTPPPPAALSRSTAAAAATGELCNGN